MPFDVAALRRSHQHLLAESDRAIASVLDDSPRVAREHVLDHAEFHHRTGALQRATTGKVVRTGSGRVVRIFNKKPYAAAIDRGAKPHVIRPRKAGMLRFVAKGGGIVFARKVNHPGNRPYRFLYYATDAAGRVARKRIEEQLSQVASASH